MYMDIWKIIEIEKAKHDIKSDRELASRCGWSPQNLYDKRHRDYINTKDLEKIANAMNCNLVITFEDIEK